MIKAFATFFGNAAAVSILEKMSHVHPRVIGWQIQQGHLSKKHVLDLLEHNWSIDFYNGQDAHLFKRGGSTLLPWVPDTVIDKKAGYEFFRLFYILLNSMGAKPGKRMKNGLPSLYFGHRHYKPRDWPGTNQPKNPVRAKYLLQALHEVYRRFSFNPVLMDALAGRSTQQDLQQPKICAIAYFLSIIRETPCDPKVQKNAEAEFF